MKNGTVHFDGRKVTIRLRRECSDEFASAQLRRFKDKGIPAVVERHDDPFEYAFRLRRHFIFIEI